MSLLMGPPATFFISSENVCFQCWLTHDMSRSVYSKVHGERGSACLLSVFLNMTKYIEVSSRSCDMTSHHKIRVTALFRNDQRQSFSYSNKQTNPQKLIDKLTDTGLLSARRSPEPARLGVWSKSLLSRGSGCALGFCLVELTTCREAAGILKSRLSRWFSTLICNADDI